MDEPEDIIFKLSKTNSVSQSVDKKEFHDNIKG
jgi:hypothetical protein